MRVGLFDSGIGGLTVLREFIKKYPLSEYVYYGDTINMPYGNKSKEELLILSTKIIKFLESEKVDIIIIACGTVSSNIYEELTKITSIPIYNVIDPTINYIKNKHYKKISIMATEATINSKVFNRKLDIEIQSIKCPLLVPLIENNSEELINVLKKYLDEITDTEAIVLGCTHYAVVEELIKKYKNIDVINMGKIISDDIKLKDTKSGIYLSFSKVDDKLKQNVEGILRC